MSYIISEIWEKSYFWHLLSVSFKNMATFSGSLEAAGTDYTTEHKVPAFVNSKFTVATRGDWFLSLQRLDFTSK